MKTRMSLLALIVIGMSMPVLSDSNVPLQPQHYNRDYQGEDSGNVMFTGSVYASPCVLAPESRLQTVDLGEISARGFHRSGDRSKPAVIRIELRDCLKGASQSRSSLAARTTGNNKNLYTTGEQAVQMTLLGESDEHNSQLLRMTGGSSGAAIRLLDAKQRPLDINQTHAPFVVKSGDSSQTFLAVLESTGRNVSAGNFSGTLRLKMEYQ
ncbi:fimbrial protein [uncultured Cedecea sp.]|uniref:fimbrial protein n=1 Tax=uncultured Cedecea sp. TaxID=988762 RepID=UPI002628E160|nr:fimbrial protein [uncultured Cedecea sp.]